MWEFKSLDTLFLTLILLTLVLTSRAIYLLYFHTLSPIPGPKAWIFSRIPFALALRSGDLHRTLKKLHATYGLAVRVAADEVFFADAQAWQDIFVSSGHEKFPKNPTWFKKYPNGVHTLHSASNHKHAELRRKLSPAFSAKALREQEPMIQTTVDLFVTRLRENAKGSSVINLKDWFNYLSFDLTGQVTFSESFGCLDNDRYHHWADALQKWFKVLALNATARFFPILQPLISHLLPTSLWAKRQNHLSQVQQVVHARFKQGRNMDQTDLLACASKEKGNLNLSDEEIEALMSVTILAGSEATATSLSSIAHHLLQAPADLLRLTSEIRTAFSKESEMTMESVAHLPYLNAVIDESLRLGSSIPGLLTRIVPAPGALVCGYWLPTGTRVNISPHAMYRSPSNFSRPDTFLPIRWLPDSQPQPVHIPKAFQPFSLGPRNCVGQRLGIASLRLISAKLFWNFDIVRVGVAEDWETQKSWLVWEKRALNVHLMPVRVS